MDVLVVDDEEDVRRMLCVALRREQHQVSEAASAEQALEALEQRRFDVVLLDIRMQGMSGLDALIQIRERAPEPAVIMVTGESSTANALNAGRGGAYDFVTKPLDGDQIEYLLDAVNRAGRITRGRRSEAASGTAGVATPGAAGAATSVTPGAAAPGTMGPQTGTEPGAATGDNRFGLLGDSPALRALLDQVRRIGTSQGRVLISGENGSGKELVAAALHRLSRRSAGPFVKLNCAALPRELVESELFGHERGAFTHAVQSRKGRIEQADHGTLFLDEVGDLALEAQAKLLRAIETGELERVGGTRTVSFDVRFIAATNKDLAAAMESGRFREDLFYRLNVLPVHVPPLRERRTDVVPLARHFLAAFCASEGRATLALSDEAGALLKEYPWPGNVRELRNLMERAAVLIAGETVRAEDLAVWLETPGARDEAVGLRGEIERRESEAVRRALEAADGNVTQAAAALGIDRTNLHRKIRKYGIERR
ncbi:MAG: sigma-54-dependent Fis family transcriptional regulator [Candidatus Eisenbacteria bacterium]|nr:sigma-54-dependent Fis family transcriptional regulator [Candidatus Eisenbacteria bacterium]